MVEVEYRETAWFVIHINQSDQRQYWTNEGIKEKQLYLNIGDQGHRATIENALTRPGSFGLKSEDALHIVTGMSSTVKDNWENVFRDCGVPEKIFPELKAVSFSEVEKFNLTTGIPFP